MQIPIHVTFKDMPVSDAVEAQVRHDAAHLERYFRRITRCAVTIASPHRHHHQGCLYSVRVDLTVPGREIVVNREHPIDHAHADVYVAIRDAFRSTRRRLQDHVRRMRGQVKTHKPRKPRPTRRSARQQ